MIIYKCAISNDEMFSDIYKIKEHKDGILIEVEGKVITRGSDIDGSLIGANPSAEEVSEVTEESTISGVDIVLNSKLEETHFNKDNYKSYIKKYMKAIAAHLKTVNPERVQQFMVDAPQAVKEIIGKIKDYQFYTGESMDPDGAVGLLNYREDNVTPYMLFFKDGLITEKC